MTYYTSTYASNSLFEIRRAVGRATHRFRYGTVQDMSTPLGIVDANLYTDQDSFWNGQFLYFPTATIHMVYRVNEQASGIVTAVPTIPADVVGWEYELWKNFSPDDVYAAINDMLAQQRYIDEAYVTFSSGFAYAPTPALTVVGLDIPQNLGMYSPMRGYEVHGRVPTLHMELTNEGVQALGTTVTVRCRFARSYETMTAEGSTTHAPLDWLVPAVAAQLYSNVYMGSLANQNRDEVLRNISFFKQQAQEALAKYGGSHAHVAQTPRSRITQ